MNQDKAKSGGVRSKSQQQQYFYESSTGDFDYSLPRPPALGEEKTHCPPEWQQQMERASGKLKSSSPHPRYELEEASSRHGRPTKGGASLSTSPPACLLWAQSLHNLLEDSEGVKLFQKYLESEGSQHVEALHFWFACLGLKNHKEADKILKLVKLIYKTYFMKSVLPIDEDLRREITRNLKSPQCLDPPVTLFDEAQAQIEHLINKTTYPNFLKSDMYLQYLQSAHNPSSEEFSAESSASSSPVVARKDLTNLAGAVGPLPTLHEDQEFTGNPQPPLLGTPGTGNFSTGYRTPTCAAGGAPRLTKDMLLQTQKHRALDIRPKSETYAGLFMSRGSGTHAAYNSYNPVSRQDSEMQSLSSHSDARTESDNLSISESLMDVRSSSRRHKSSSLEAKQAHESAALNRETDMHHPVIPRTKHFNVPKIDSREFYEILYEKLAKVKKDQDSKELLDRRLKESDSLSSLDDKSRSEAALARPAMEGSGICREELQDQDDNVQDILDEHVSRVFTDHYLAMSPRAIASPRSMSPMSRGRLAHAHHMSQPMPRQQQEVLQRARATVAATTGRGVDRDVLSTFSGDSGNVHDFADGSEYRRGAMVKSKSTPEYPGDRLSWRSASRKTLAGMTDSGVSGLSEVGGGGGGGGGHVAGMPSVPIETSSKRGAAVMMWVMEAESRRRAAATGRETMSEMAVREGVVPRNRHNSGSSRNRSSSLERSGASESVAPAQPFVADPNMPPLPHPNTATQLEEARRRLIEEDIRAKSRLRPSTKYNTPEGSASQQSTMRKSMRFPRQAAPPPAEDVTTTVVYSYSDERFPYRTKLQGTQITLRQFKENLPKKGNYRYYFKTICDDEVAHEEVRNDWEVLPLFEGKIMAQVYNRTDGSNQKTSEPNLASRMQ